MPFSEFVLEVRRRIESTHYNDLYVSSSHDDIDKLTTIWERFKENFLWWEVNRNLLRDIHILNYCDDWDRAKHARTPATGFAKRNGKIDWSKS